LGLSVVLSKMKNRAYLPVLFCIVTLFVGCDKFDDPFDAERTVTVIGIDPCTVNYPVNSTTKGYVLLLNSTRDTVVCYGLPLSIAQKVEASLKLKNNYLLAPEAVVTASLSYRFAAKDEMIYPVCLANVLTEGFAKYNNRQIKITGRYY